MTFFNAKLIGQILKDYLGNSPLGEAFACENIAKNKQMIFGTMLAGHVDVLSLKSGILFVVVNGSSFRHEIEISKNSIINRAKMFSNGFNVKDIKIKR